MIYSLSLLRKVGASRHKQTCETYLNTL